MHPLLVRVMLSGFVLPAGMLVYFACWIGADELGFPPGYAIPVAVLGAWLVVAVGWTSLWWPTLRWTRRRIAWGLASALIAALVLMIATAMLGTIANYSWVAETLFGFSAVGVPIVWLAFVILLFRETPGERALRRAGAAAILIVCPRCRYNLGPLTQAICPECGGKWTIASLIAQQRAGHAEEVDELFTTNGSRA